MRGLSSTLSFLCDEFNKLNNTGARILDSFYHNDSKITLKSHFGVNKLRFCHYVRNGVMNVIISNNHKWFIDFNPYTLNRSSK